MQSHPIVVPGNPVVTLPASYKDQLLETLRGSASFTEAQKQDIENTILANPEMVARFENDRRIVIEALDSIDREINLDLVQQVERQVRQYQEEIRREEEAPAQQPTQPLQEDAQQERGNCAVCFEAVDDRCMALPCSRMHRLHIDCIKESCSAS